MSLSSQNIHSPSQNPSSASSSSSSSSSPASSHKQPPLLPPPTPTPTAVKRTATSPLRSVSSSQQPSASTDVSTPQRKKQRNPTNYVWTAAENRELITWTSQNLVQVWVKASVLHAHKIKKAIYSGNPQITAENIRHKVNNIKAKYRKVKGRWADAADTNGGFMTTELRMRIQNEFPDYFIIEEMIKKCQTEIISPPMSPQIQTDSQDLNSTGSPSFTSSSPIGHKSALGSSSTAANQQSISNVFPSTPKTITSTPANPSQDTTALELSQLIPQSPSTARQSLLTSQQQQQHSIASLGSLAGSSSSSYQQSSLVVPPTTTNPLNPALPQSTTLTTSSPTSENIELAQLRLEKQLLQLKAERLELDVARLKSSLHFQEMSERQRQCEHDSVWIATQKSIAELKLVEYRVKLAIAQFEAIREGRTSSLEQQQVQAPQFEDEERADHDGNADDEEEVIKSTLQG